MPLQLTSGTFDVYQQMKEDPARIKAALFKAFGLPPSEAYEQFTGGARGVMVIVAGIGHGDTSSNPGLIAFHIALIPLGKV